MLSIYACGGTGLNIAKNLTDAGMNVFCIDGSDSNTNGLSKDKLFVIPDSNGGGKNRAVIYEKFRDLVDEVLIRFKPSTSMNIVLSSLAGGSGSAIGPILAKQLIEEGKNVIILGIDSTSSVIEINNSIKTLKTYKAISNQLKKSVSIYHVKGDVRREADEQAINFINLISLMVDKSSIDELDVRDLENFLQFQNVTDNRPDVAILAVNHKDGVEFRKGINLVGTVLVSTDRNDTITDFIPEYIANCVVTDKKYKNGPMRLDSMLGELGYLINDYEATLQELSDQKKINRVKELDVESNTDDGFMVL